MLQKVSTESLAEEFLRFIGKDGHNLSSNETLFAGFSKELRYLLTEVTPI